MSQPIYVFGLSALATAGLAVMWAIFWRAAAKQGGSRRNSAQSGVFRKVTVMGVIAATAC